jgi:hypothetical protein
MRGHEHIIEMRMNRQKPAVVFLDTMPDASPLKAWRDWPEHSPAIATVWIEPGDVPHRLDLRYLIGMVVVVSGTDPMRVRAVEFEAIEAGASTVIAAEVEPDESAYKDWHTTAVRDSRSAT